MGCGMITGAIFFTACYI
jgi:hypothetical protein